MILQYAIIIYHQDDHFAKQKKLHHNWAKNKNSTYL